MPCGAGPPVLELCQNYEIVWDCHFCRSQMVGYWQFYKVQSNRSQDTVVLRRF